MTAIAGQPHTLTIETQYRTRAQMLSVQYCTLAECSGPRLRLRHRRGDSAQDISSGLQALIFLLTWVRVGVKRVAGAAATVVAVEYVSAPVVAFAVGEPVLTFVVSVHSLVVAGCAGDLALVWSGVFGAH